MRLSWPMPRRTSLMSAPTRSQTLAISLMKLILVGQHGVGDVLGHLGAFRRHHQQRLVGPQVRFVEVRQHVGHLRPPHADDHAVGLHEVVDGHPFLEKLGIARHVDVAAGQLLQPGRQSGVGAHRHRALADHDALRADVGGQRVDDRPEGLEVDRPVVGGRGADGQEHQPRLFTAETSIDRKLQPAAGHVAGDQLGQPRLIDRNVPAVEHVDLPPVVVDAGDVVARLGQAGARDQPHVTCPNHSDFHVGSLQASAWSLRKPLDGPSLALGRTQRWLSSLPHRLPGRYPGWGGGGAGVGPGSHRNKMGCYGGAMGSDRD